MYNATRGICFILPHFHNFEQKVPDLLASGMHAILLANL